MGIRNRIVKYIDHKMISKYKFYQIIGVSNGFLDKTGSIGSDKCEKISYVFPDLNMTWLLTGKGEMILESSTETVPPITTPISHNMDTESFVYKKLLQEKEEEIKKLNREIGRLEERLKLHIENEARCLTSSVCAGDP